MQIEKLKVPNSKIESYPTLIKDKYIILQS